jgi:hypothetical protein
MGSIYIYIYIYIYYVSYCHGIHIWITISLPADEVHSLHQQVESQQQELEAAERKHAEDAATIRRWRIKFMATFLILYVHVNMCIVQLSIPARTHREKTCRGRSYDSKVDNEIYVPIS